MSPELKEYFNSKLQDPEFSKHTAALEWSARVMNAIEGEWVKYRTDPLLDPMVEPTQVEISRFETPKDAYVVWLTWSYHKNRILTLEITRDGHVDVFYRNRKEDESMLFGIDFKKYPDKLRTSRIGEFLIAIHHEKQTTDKEKN